MVKKRQKTIPVLSPSLLLFLLLPATPIEPSIDEDNKGKDKNIKEPVEVEDKDISSPLPPPPPPLTHFISV